MTDLFLRYCKDESGATAIEYALVVSIMLTALIAIIGTGGTVEAMYQSLLAIVAAMS